MALLTTARSPRNGRGGLDRALLIATLLAACARPALSADDEAPSEYDVKAAFLFNFVSFVEWPEQSLPEDELVIGVLGEDPFGGALERLVSGEKHGGRTIAVRRFRNASEAVGAQVLFVNVDDEDVEAVLARLAERPVLTVGEGRDFARRGGMIHLRLESDRVRFEVNQAAARQAGLKISSHLLKLALRVHGAERKRSP